MQEQNFKNHARLVPEFHIVMLLTVVAILVLSIINLFSGITIPAILFLLIAVALSIGYWKIRAFPLKVQDRAIRAEENLRYFSLTGKLLDNRLTMGQIIALRFASNEELIELVDRAINEKLSNREIKKAIRNWKSDHHRA